MNHHEIRIDARELTERERAHACLRAALESRDYIGSNLDALHDVLTSICHPTHIVLENISAARAAENSYLPRVLGVLTDAAIENPHLTYSTE